MTAKTDYFFDGSALQNNLKRSCREKGSIRTSAGTKKRIACCFSPTGTTRAVCVMVARGIGDSSPTVLDLTLPGGRTAMRRDAGAVVLPFDHVVIAQTNGMEEIVSAFDDALGKALKRIVQWTLVQGHRGWLRRRRVVSSLKR